MVDDAIVISILMPPIYASLLNNFRSALKSGVPRYSRFRHATIFSGQAYSRSIKVNTASRTA